ncbi:MULTISPECIES: C-terminal binding protein [unclassified Pseudoclavibacter]|uniref:C-terminal binding protein n=1 Tax=unclassified Pseudoclavibacter TaxID=2615177 RepID=UPI000CE822E5|nr:MULTISPECIES: C-terminal binding protein [unclassified Pseudoclavibacter]MBF4550718.1 C-terminal binding protein [Pseudoclavibacter sp. VKM Ac-2888]PPF34639.1 hypothetical protein C5E05_15095 [Pseudoclavibacter sp. AY1H1]PPF77990.1 hypothetical protein C5B99_01380 [Pseudoclavibacter sp. Z016]PPG05471.1 hypothetical protein C5E06_00970 [Pseudoclavibacter sp. RFBI5]
MASYKVVLTNSAVPLAEEAEKAFLGMDVEFVTVDAPTEDELIRVAGDADAIIALAEPLSRRVIDSLSRCRSITRFGIGLDGVDIDAATSNGMWVTNVPDSNYREVAVHAITLALSVSRRIASLDQAMHRDGTASLALAAGTRRPDDQTFGLLGIGRIGRRVASMASAIGYHVQAYDPGVSADDIRALGFVPVSFDELVETSDILSLHVPLLESTRNIISSAVIDRMPAGAALINVSRGGLVDEGALAAAIRSGRLAGAGIDAREGEPAPMSVTNPLRGLERVVLTPHSAHYSVESLAETKSKALDDVARALRGESPIYAVNDPLSLRIG